MTPPAVAQRRARVQELLSQDGASCRTIAAELGVSKDTVARDIRALATPDATPEAPAETLSQRLAHRASQTETAMRQLSDAAQAVDAATPAHTPTDDETARRWCEQLRDTAFQLLRAADEFATYYPAAVARDTETGGAP